MELIKNKSFGGERPLFGAHDVRLEDIRLQMENRASSAARTLNVITPSFMANTLGGMWTVPLSQTATSLQKAVLPSGIVIIW